MEKNNTPKTIEKKPFVQPHHRFTFWFLRIVAHVICALYGFTYEKFPIKKGEQYLILSNHQTDLDPVFLGVSMTGPLYMLATDNIFKNKLVSRILIWWLSPIAKKKGESDLVSIRTMQQVAKEGGSIVIFPEGNTAWADEQFFIGPATCKLVRILKMPLILYNIEGGYGAAPRWGKGRRKGSFHGSVKRILSKEEIAAMTTEELLQVIKETLKVEDAGRDFYKSTERAEYFERMAFACPVCGKMQTVYSEGTKIHCRNCGPLAEYTEDLYLKPLKEGFTFSLAKSWYHYQQDLIKNLEIPETAPVFTDEEVELYDATGRKKELLGKGTMTAGREGIRVANVLIPASEITSWSVTGGTKVLLNTDEKAYFIAGPARFNPVKYALLLNRLETACKEENYYGLGN